MLKTPVLIRSGGGIHNYLYQLKLSSQDSAQTIVEGSNILGKLQITWRTNLGEPGRLQTQQILGTVSGCSLIQASFNLFVDIIPCNLSWSSWHSNALLYFFFFFFFFLFLISLSRHLNVSMTCIHCEWSNWNQHCFGRQRHANKIMLKNIYDTYLHTNEYFYVYTCSYIIIRVRI